MLLVVSNGENNSGRTWLRRVFTQPGSKADLEPLMLRVRCVYRKSKSERIDDHAGSNLFAHNLAVKHLKDFVKRLSPVPTARRQ
jgi:hypothetical protein